MLHREVPHCITVADTEGCQTVRRNDGGRTAGSGQPLGIAECICKHHSTGFAFSKERHDRVLGTQR